LLIADLESNFSFSEFSEEILNHQISNEAESFWEKIPEI
jgi:hypothetical protein